MSKHRWNVGGAAVRDTLAVAIIAAAAPAGARSGVDPVALWRPIAIESSARFGIPIDWIERVMRAESGGRTTIGGSPIRSKVGAIGLMQLMPATWAMMRDSYHLGADPDDPHDNILAGTAYLRLMRDRYGYPGLFAAYNAGPARYAAYLAGRSRLPTETIAYVGRLTGSGHTVTVMVRTPPRELLFLLRRGLGSDDQPPPGHPAGDGLFAIWKGLR
jgi:soluble lytic murein transglycosylase-like protein